MEIIQNQPILASKRHSRSDFGSDFTWGISSSAYQTEGAYLTDGKGPSIWDDFTQIKGRIHNNHNGNEACNFYEKYSSDLHLINELGIKNFRFSISWARILPEGTGKVNDAGVAFYHDLIDRCLDLGITPWICLYHWDLPLALEKKGGWANRDIITWFEEYTALCAKQFGDRVKNWIVLNEPLVFTGAGYFFGVHAPGRKSMNDFLAAVHHAVLCQAAGAKVLRQLVVNAQIGTTISCSQITPKNDRGSDQKAAIKVDALLNRLFVEPFLGLGYPRQDLKGLRMMEKFILPGDEDRMVFDFDFLGLQYYTREIVKHSLFTPIVQAKIVPHHKREAELTAMNWEVYPQGLYEMIMKFSAYEGIKKIIITENGAAFNDQSHSNLVNDPSRIQFLDNHFEHMLRAKKEGSKVAGYFVWTLLDNFEWAEGYRPRFGLIYVDFKSQKRILKQSSLWYASYLSN